VGWDAGAGSGAGSAAARTEKAHVDACVVHGAADVYGAEPRRGVLVGLTRSLEGAVEDAGDLRHDLVPHGLRDPVRVGVVLLRAVLAEPGRARGERRRQAAQVRPQQMGRGGCGLGPHCE